MSGLPKITLLILTALLCATGASYSQVQVEVSLKRMLFMRYEPVMVTVSITNLTGRELELSDSGVKKWFGFQIDTPDGRPIPPINPDYENPSIQIGSGQKITRVINLTPLYPISEFGTYRVKATLYMASMDRYFSSGVVNIEVTEGRIIWQKTVGVPDGAPGAGTDRSITLLSHRLPSTTMLYVRIEDKEHGIIYCTHQLGRLVSFGNPIVELDASNQVHVLQNIAPKAFLHSQIGLNGEVIKRETFQETGSQPVLRRTEDGAIVVVGGLQYDANAQKESKDIPSLHERPAPLPTPQSKAAPKKEDQRPENLLSQ